MPDQRALLNSLALTCSLLLWTGIAAQPVTSDSTYLRMQDKGKAIDAMRFDLKSYRDTIRAYRDALDGAITGIDASSAAGEDKRARYGRIRQDLNSLEKEMKRTRKRTKYTSTAPLGDLAHGCSDLIQRVVAMRRKLLAEHVQPAP